MEYSLYNKKVYCKSSTKCCVKGPQGLKGDTGKTDIQYAIIYFEDSSLNDISNAGGFYSPDISLSDTSNNGIINELIYDTSNNCLNLSSIENIDDYIVEIYTHLDINLTTSNKGITLFMNLTDKDNSDNVIDIDTRSVTKKNQDTHVTFGPVLYKAKDLNNKYKLHIDTYSDQAFEDSEYLSEIKLIIKLIKYK
jgi:hypothetical protein